MAAEGLAEVRNRPLAAPLPRSEAVKASTGAAANLAAKAGDNGVAKAQVKPADRVVQAAIRSKCSTARRSFKLQI